jgi:hypothetical protein
MQVPSELRAVPSESRNVSLSGIDGREADQTASRVAVSCEVAIVRSWPKQKRQAFIAALADRLDASDTGGTITAEEEE